MRGVLPDYAVHNMPVRGPQVGTAATEKELPQ